MSTNNADMEIEGTGAAKNTPKKLQPANASSSQSNSLSNMIPNLGFNVQPPSIVTSLIGVLLFMKVIALAFIKDPIQIFSISLANILVVKTNSWTFVTAPLYEHSIV